MIMENSFDYVPSGAWVAGGCRVRATCQPAHGPLGYHAPLKPRRQATGDVAGGRCRAGFGPVLPPGSGAHGDFGISTEPMMYTVAFAV